LLFSWLTWTLDLLTVPDRDVWAYGQNLRALAVSTGCTRISFTRLKDIVDIPNLPETIDEITYVANASNFRRALLNQFGDPKLDVEQVIRDDEDTRMTYCGYKRFLTNDLRFIFTRGDDRSGKQYKRDVKYLAHQMIIRGIVSAHRTKTLYLPCFLGIELMILATRIGFRCSREEEFSSLLASKHSPVNWC